MSDRIDAATLQAAERLFGVRYTDAERAQMLGNIDAQVAAAVKRRALALGNALPPATIFDPRLPGFSMPAQAGMNVAIGGAALPGSDEAIAFAPVRQLAGWIRDGVLTSARLTEIYLARIERLNPRLFCFATVTAELARAQAAKADRLLARGTWLGPLHGIPYAVKDLVDTAGVVTGWGAEPYRDRVPETDGAVVRLLAEAGAVLLGKASLGAMAFGDIWYGGTTRNPWNTEEGSRGSSAGSASATGAGLCGFAIGSETLGSIVIPAARCGVRGCGRPSGVCLAPGRWRCAGRWIGWGRWRGAWMTPRWCWRRSTGAMRRMRRASRRRSDGMRRAAWPACGWGMWPAISVIRWMRR